ncbi:uncharacterized protein EDB91DRAFT_1241942 [Suillus paluster]|uniref:uncharacterized protein n=1 Tax=Suillus paluster TaxID=48578 RepID=UPI001B85D674|nr:uncharacterized protein EDB91DRAFT_1241942 [Suillus paluster]KAG1756900.1 hypothetical protein EDB91DRAFT_1241942 [Suillus paluster]
MASYDSASTSQSVCSPHVERHRLRRKRSPSPSSQHFSVNPFAAHRPYSPSTRASDIARLLDPAYASPSHQTAFKALSPRTAIKEVYVDHHGDLHDPDFRDFPTFGHAKSRWERSYTDESDDAEEDEENFQRRVSIEKQRRRPSTTPYYVAPAYYHYDEPSSYESRHLAEVDDEDDQLDHHERAPLKEKCFITRSKSPEKHSQSEKETYPQNPHVEEPEPIAADSDFTPTCGHVIRRQWHAFTLSLRFSLFRTKRRIQRRMSG